MLVVNGQDAPSLLEFAPHVSATCKAGTMNIKVKFDGPYTGAVHARDYRTSACMTTGDGTDTIAFSLNLLAKQGAADYCGVLISNVSGYNNVSTLSASIIITILPISTNPTDHRLQFNSTTVQQSNSRATLITLSRTAELYQ